jgi:hypothetical protein
MTKKRKLNTVTVSRPHIVEAPPVRASTFHRAKGRLVASNAIVTPNEHLDEEPPHLNPWQDQFCEAFAAGVSDSVSGGQQAPKVSSNLQHYLR